MRVDSGASSRDNARAPASRFLKDGPDRRTPSPHDHSPGAPVTTMTPPRLLLLLLALAGLAALASARDFQLEDHPLYRKFHAWRRLYRRQYATEAEEGRRFMRWVDSFYEVEAHNHEARRRPHAVTYTLAVNGFADLSWAEFKALKLMEGQNCSATHQLTEETAVAVDARLRRRRRGLLRGDGGGLGDLPEAIDWREKGAVSPVKNQGSCGSCWTFSTTGALESHHFLKYGGPMELFSEQQLVDCAQAFDNNGCRGGLPSHAFEYLHYAGGAETEDEYPYQAAQQRCQFNASEARVRVKASANITFQDEDELVEAIGTVGPVSVAFQVAPDFRLYDCGVYNSQICASGPENVNHAVLAVGYGIDGVGGPFYWIKNSWGPEWGIGGYFMHARGLNLCGIADCASYPLIE